MQKFRKYISFSLILNLLLFSSGQAYIFSDCECLLSEPSVVDFTNCSDEVVDTEEEVICCASESGHVKVKFENITSHSCADCSFACSKDENIEYSSPALFASSSYSFNKLDVIESEHIFYKSENLNTSDINSKLTRIQNDEIPKLFGKNLLIQTHTLKIPLILV
ncbi:MAG: hypothetical protein KAI45_02885 [Melioribacteraceae bacterium]|nr:hypothetical protein [Melioribacteraceae bacterium]